jgi:hypothetical protein
MKWIVIAVVAVLGGCSKDAPPKQQSVSQPVIVDSATVAAFDDSVLESSRADTVVTAKGDTLVSFGGVMMDDASARDFVIRHYAKNGTHFLRVAQATSRRSDGTPVWTVVARLRLPSVKSPDDVAIEGLCDKNGKNDPLIIAVTGPPIDSVSYQAVRAWRLDPTKKTVRQIPADSVTCGHVIGED